MANFRSEANRQLQPETTDAVAAPVHAGIGWWLLVLHLALSPVIFCVHTAEVFEENKVAFLKLIAWALTGVGLSAWVGGACPVRTRLTDLVGRNLISGGVILFVVSAIVSTSFSISPLTSWRGAAESCGGLQTILGYGVLFLATRALCRTPADGRRLLLAAVFATAVVCGHAVLQIAGRDPIPWDGVSSFATHLRPFGTLAHANSLGAYLVMTIPLVAAFAQQSVQERRWFAALLATGLSIVAAAVVLVTLSRAAWLGLAVALTLLIVGWLFSAAKRSGLVLVGIGLICIGLGGAGTARGWFGPSFTESVRARVTHVHETAGRRQIWRSAWAMFCEHPVTGTGLDTFRLGFGPHRTAEYWQSEGDSTPTKAHNEFLHVLATQGSVGGGAVLVFLAGLTVGGLRAWRRCGPTDRPFVTAVVASLVGFLLTNLTGFTVVGCGALFVCCAALLSRWQESTGLPVINLRGRRGLERWPLAAGLLAVLLYGMNMGFDHCLLCFGLGGCGAIVALVLVGKHGAADRSLPSLADGPSGVGVPRWGRLVRLGVGLGTVVVVVVNIWCPFQASCFCAVGDRFLNEKPNAAQMHYQRAVTWDSNRDMYYVRLSAAAQLCARQARTLADQQRDFGLARHLLEQALTLVPADPYHYANLARLLSEVGYRDAVDRQTSATVWDRALQMDPKNICFIAEAARGALALGDRARARRLGRKGLDLYPDFALFHAQLGACSLAEGRLTEAAEMYEKAVHADWHGNTDDEARAYAALASCHLGLGHPECARDLARHASTLEPHWPTAALFLAQALEALGDYENAFGTYQQVLSVALHHPAALAGIQRLESRVHRPSATHGPVE